MHAATRAISQMTVMDAIYGRHAVRDYQDKPVDSTLVRQLLDAAVHAPSAMNQQPWAFAVVHGRQRLREYSDKVRAELLTHLAADSPLLSYRQLLQQPDFNVFYGAPTMIVVLARPPGLNCNEDCCLAAQNLMLTAHALRLGTCPIGFARPWLNTAAGRALVKLPERYEVVMPIAVGWPSGKIEAHPRKPAEIVSWIE